MKIFIITEGGRDIGFGHITRCLSLYQAFEEKGLMPELIVNADETVDSLLKDKNYKALIWQEKAQDFLEGIKNADMVIVDSYLAGSGLYKKIAKTAKVSVYLDDNKRIDYPKGIVVNGAIYAERLDYIKKDGVTYLLGAKYAPLRMEFWKIPEKEVKERIESVMVSFGGDDSRNMTPKVLRLLSKEYPRLIKKVIIGKGFKNIKEIESVKGKNIDLLYYPGADGMRELMLESDIAISAAGQTLYELARVGVPTVAIEVADNQLNNIKGWQDSGFIGHTGHWQDRGVFEKLGIFMEEMMDPDIRKEKCRIGRSFIDGQGSRRIAEYLLNI